MEHLKAEINRLKEELSVTERLLGEANRVIDAIPECPVHGRCIPFAIEWVEVMKSRECPSGRVYGISKVVLSSVIENFREPFEDVWLDRPLLDKITKK